ncbi:MAG: hypothetical protein ACLQOO_19660 [Terriglobia bacterium]
MGNNFAMPPRRSPRVDLRTMVIIAGKKRPLADREAALAGIAGGNTVLGYAANGDIFSKPTTPVMASKRIPTDGPVFSKKGDAVTQIMHGLRAELASEPAV